ncbi:MAG: serine protease-like protein, partial [Nanoarchaeota archaeon]
MKAIATAALMLTLILSIPSPAMAATSGHMTLLTVAENDEMQFGGTADVYLEIHPGKGRVFIDSLPLTKLDTQISTRFAHELACDFLEMDCSNKDFFYTIRADSSVVGGPSAGGALTVLTIAVLGDLPLDNETVMTGTIQSGGLIGPVAGIK